MNVKAKILWGVTVVGIAGAAVGISFGSLSTTKDSEQREYVEESVKTIKKRNCSTVEPILAERCKFRKQLTIGILEQFTWNTDPENVLRYAASSANVDDYSKAKDLVEEVRKEMGPVDAISFLTNNWYTGINDLSPEELDEYYRLLQEVDSVPNKKIESMRTWDRVMAKEAKNKIEHVNTELLITKAGEIQNESDHLEGIAMLGGCIGGLAAILLMLVGVWNLFLTMVRSFRRAWYVPTTTA